jgi:hypothetical protein
LCDGPWDNAGAALDNLIDDSKDQYLLTKDLGTKDLYLFGRSAYLVSVSSKRARSHSAWWLGSGGAQPLQHLPRRRLDAPRQRVFDVLRLAAFNRTLTIQACCLVSGGAHGFEEVLRSVDMTRGQG